MAVIYKCDRCGKDKSRKELVKMVLYSTFGENRWDGSVKGYHLCPECKEAIKNVLGKGQNDLTSFP